MNATRNQETPEPPNLRHPSRWNTIPVPPRVAERAYTRKEVDPETGCWVSTYSRASHGYAQIGWQEGGDRFCILAHRASWTHVNGQVPMGVTLDHTCKTRPCVNPEHLRILPNYENARRTNGDDWEFGTCSNGHSNMFLRIDPHRKTKSGKQRNGLRCSKCVVMYGARFRWRSKYPGKPMPDHLLLRAEREQAKQDRDAA